ncbi:MAG: hypothetical protein AB7H93_23550 [Vicinamibacterales bacterium]
MNAMARARVEAAREATDIEALLHWTFARQKADRARVGADHAVMLYAGGVDSVTRVAEACQLGTIIGGGGRAVAALDVHPDAERVAAMLDPYLAADALVISHARAGSRPDARTDACPRIVPVMVVKGGIERPKVVWSGEPGRRKAPLYCEVRTLDHPAVVASARAAYQRWWRRVGALAEVLMAGEPLARWRVTGFIAPFAPWSAAGDVTDWERVAASWRKPS